MALDGLTYCCPLSVILRHRAPYNLGLPPGEIIFNRREHLNSSLPNKIKSCIDVVEFRLGIT